MAYIYMLRCEDGSLYTGITKNMRRRMREHYYKKKSGAKYTRSRQIQSLEMVWETEEWSYAAKLEFRIKQLDRPHKEELIADPQRVREIAGLCEESISYEPHPEWELHMYLEDEQEQEV
ncbi:MAG: GIY-YIG nuclease family protein [Clostridiales bacterium]|nr:GIY-YIG nuclease family protein [Clostridiales bacterium]